MGLANSLRTGEGPLFSSLCRAAGVWDLAPEGHVSGIDSHPLLHSLHILPLKLPREPGELEVASSGRRDLNFRTLSNLYSSNTFWTCDCGQLNLNFLISKIVTIIGILHCCAEDSVRCETYVPSTCLMESTHLIFK